MADDKQFSKGQRDQQLTATQEAAHAAQIDGRLKDLHTCMPGIIASFNPDTQTASVQPAIQRIFTEKGPVNLPLCVDVPVAFPGGGDFFLTFPVKKDDECILFFSERCIDFWHEKGGVQLPAEYRLHDLSDAFAQVGVNSQPKKLTALQMDGAELRTRSRSTYIRLTEGTIYVKGNIIHEGNTTQTGNVTQTGNITQTGSMTLTGDTARTGATTTSGVITGAGGLAVSGGAGAAVSGNMAITGGDVTADGKSIKNHHHVEHDGYNTGNTV